MINSDQPTIFGDNVIAAVSSVHSGPMNFRNNDPEEIADNELARKFYLGRHFELRRKKF